MHVTDRHPDDEGFTLTELLISIVVLGVIMLPLGNALIGFIRHTDETTRRMSESHDVQIASAYFAQDVQSIGARDWSIYPFPLRQSVELDAPALGGRYPCGDAGTPAAVVRFAWDDPTSASGAPDVVRVSYVVVTAGADRELHRIRCVGSATPVSDLVLAHNVDTTDPVLACSTTCTAAPDVPQTITLTLAIKNPQTTSGTLTIALTGQRRQT